MSDDGEHGLTLIAFVGSVFSPYYKWARRRGPADPENHCALNVALYGRQKRWAMTERGRRHCARDRTQFVIGPSQLEWDGQCLHVHINEICVPFLSPLRGHIRVWPQQLVQCSVPLDDAGRHRWGPLAPHARVEVDMQNPAQRWHGHAYLDSNEGDEPLEEAFHHWDWSRTLLNDGSTVVNYDLQWPDRAPRLLRMRFTADGEIEHLPEAPPQDLPRTAWRIQRRMRSASRVQVQDQLEDTPFYQRSLLRHNWQDQPVWSFHESLSVPRFVSPVVQSLLPWRMPRRG
jgi:carotenoid 1,2-hydratase